MKIKLISIIFVILSSILFIGTISPAQALSAGVSKGETFDYTYSIIWSSTDPAASPPSKYLESNNTQRQLKINDLSGSIINVDYIKHFKNGTSSTQSGTINIDTGAITVPYGFLIIGSNISKNQQVYPNGGHQTITDMVTRSYSSGQRETNVIRSEELDETVIIYLDKIKGIAVDYSYQTSETFNGYTIIIKEIMVNTNSDVWSVVPEFPVFVVPLVLVAVSVALLVTRYKKPSNIQLFKI